VSSVGSNAGLHTYRMHFMAGQTNLHMSMAMDCLLLASWLGAFSVVVFVPQKPYKSKVPLVMYILEDSRPT
jgi:hypothetical protein